VTIAAGLRTRVVPLTQSRLPEWRNKAVALAFWVLIPLLCLFVLGSGADKLVRHVNNRPAGIPGLMTVTVHSCRDDACISGGTFVSSDGKTVEHGLPGLYSWQIQEKHQAVFDPSSGEVIPLPAHWDATSTAVGMAGALGFLGLWGACLYGSLKRRSPLLLGSPRAVAAG
jgi:hypothetical protein